MGSGIIKIKIVVSLRGMEQEGNWIRKGSQSFTCVCNRFFFFNLNCNKMSINSVGCTDICYISFTFV